jgi:hypothetical protein
MRPLRLLLVSLVFLLSTQGAFSQTPDDNLIVPGQRFGKYPLETTVADLARLVGLSPYTYSRVGGRLPVTDAAAPYSVAVWNLKKTIGELVLRAYSRDTVELLQLGWDPNACDLASSPCVPPEPSLEFKTDRGVSFRATRPEVEAALGRPTWDDTYQFQILVRGPRHTGTFVVYNLLGIAFWLRDGKLESFYIFRSGMAPTKHHRGQ